MVDVSVNNAFERIIIDKGYKWFDDHWKNSIRGFQKRITDHVGIKYFITGYHYNLQKQLPQHNNVPAGDSYTFTAQFTKDNVTVDIVYSDKFLQKLNMDVTDVFELKLNSELPAEVGDIDRAERFFEKMWTDFEFDYYEKNEY